MNSIFDVVENSQTLGIIILVMIVMIADYLPSGITIADSTEEIMVKVAVEQLEEKNMYLTSDAINLVGKNSDYSYSFVSGSSYLLKVKGLKDKLDNLKITNLLPSIDVSGYSPGKYTFIVNMKEIAGVEILDEVKVEIEITQN